MLRPAILYKDEIEYKFQEMVYDDKSFLYNGYPYCHELTKIELRDNHFQYAIVSDKDNFTLIGYLAYKVDPYCSCAYNFGLISFDEGNPTIGKDLFELMNYLYNHYHRIEWKMIGSNPVKKHYDKFCEKFNGTRLKLTDCLKDKFGNYLDSYIYEIINPEVN